MLMQGHMTIWVFQEGRTEESRRQHGVTFGASPRLPSSVWQASAAATGVKVAAAGWRPA
jgi:hypothetical protein